MDFLRSTYVGGRARLEVVYRHTATDIQSQLCVGVVAVRPRQCALRPLISAVCTSEAATVPLWKRGPSNSGPSSSAKREDTLLRMPGSLRASVPGNQHLGETILRGNSGEAQWGGGLARLRGVVVGSNGARFCLPTPAARARFL